MRSSLNITYLLARQNDMNRKKKLIQLLKKKSRGNPEKRLQNSKKEKYVSKAERAKLVLELENEVQLDEDKNA
jgi:hypothetical protein